MITENVSTLKINRMTQAQYERELAAGNIKDDEIYLTPIVEVGIEDISDSFIGVFETYEGHAEINSINVHKSGNVIEGSIVVDLYDVDNTDFDIRINPIYSPYGDSSADHPCNIILCKGGSNVNEEATRRSFAYIRGDTIIYNRLGTFEVGDYDTMRFSFTYICQ